MFYPKGLPQRRELEYLSRRVNTVEINGSFYSLQRPERYRRWRDATPPGFRFAVKGGRFITHMKQLRDVEAALANFFASGVLALDDKLGPVLWQLPPRLSFDAERLAEFFDRLPRTTVAAAELARRHDDKVTFEPHTDVGADRPLHHALEVRHPSFTDPAFPDLLRAHDIALVVADTAGTWPYLEDVTSGLVYVRLHGDVELYASGYTDEALDAWAEKIGRWHAQGHDVWVYFDNDIKVKAPGDAMALAERLGVHHASPGEKT
ncbi:DUF72 domain-containing protein [Saccharomonospora azurea]|uniref:DUF72 domain-containing protein n=1 Tax=Saccharomonospora azurea NA-128 TaxID=882081 RepID=H8G3U6_9PSEU|nr:DUF72 domain-containing protein [Saccharomonospora azurea]EHK87368.1 hypothetical protein SZMC14600_10523 [Saccharomonospora azurea SZMC 14600]EHY89114.1 hypothetical protein SacazDRAFT_02203 [Saccharomonospora azurea NA-128]